VRKVYLRFKSCQGTVRTYDGGSCGLYHGALFTATPVPAVMATETVAKGATSCEQTCGFSCLSSCIHPLEHLDRRSHASRPEQHPLAMCLRP
jgi:hypothetical protein